jgi:acyl-CoA synthetase (AMP-forming)/AMP-acid ligase II
LVDPTTLRDVLPGEEGEIWVQGPGVMTGYHNLPDATANALMGGWYRTGDLGCRDQHGYLRISGRIKEMIIRGGENIYPAEVEATLIDLDAVAEAAIVCVPHPELGEVPVAFIVSREPAFSTVKKSWPIAGRGSHLSKSRTRSSRSTRFRELDPARSSASAFCNG